MLSLVLASDLAGNWIKDKEKWRRCSAIFHGARVMANRERGPDKTNNIVPSGTTKTWIPWDKSDSNEEGRGTHKGQKMHLRSYLSIRERENLWSGMPMEVLTIVWCRPW